MKKQSNNQDQRNKYILIINTLSGFVAKILSLLIVIWLQQYLIQRIPQEEYSLYPVFVSLLMFLMIIKSFFTSGIARYLIGAEAVKNKKKVAEIFSSSHALNLIIAFGILLISIPLSLNIDRIVIVDNAYVTDARIMMFITMFSFCIRIGLASYESGLIVKEKFIIINFILLAQTITRLTILLFLLFGISPRVIWLVVATEISNFLGLLIVIIISRKLLPYMRFSFRNIKKDILNDILGFGTWTFLGMIANRIRTFADPLLLNRLSNPYQVSVFYLGSIFPKQLDETISHAAMTLLPNLTTLYESGQINRLRNAYLRISRIIIWAFMLAGVPLIIFHQEFMSLYTHNIYIESGMVLLILTVSEAIRQSFFSVYRISYAMAKIKTYSIISFSSQILNLGLTIILLSKFNMGGIGAALSTFIIRVLVEFPLMTYTGLKLLDIKANEWFKKTFIRGFFPALLTIAVIYPLKINFTTENLMQLVIYMLCCSIILLAFIFLFFDHEDRNDTKYLVNTLIHKFKRKYK